MIGRYAHVVDGHVINWLIWDGIAPLGLPGELIPEAEAGNIPPAPPAPPAPVTDIATERRRLSLLIEGHMDAAARAHDFEDCARAVSYCGDPYPGFAAAGEAFRAWRSAVWLTAYAIEADVMAGNRTQPTDTALLAELPAFVPPE